MVASDFTKYTSLASFSSALATSVVLRSLGVQTLSGITASILAGTAVTGVIFALRSAQREITAANGPEQPTAGTSCHGRRPVPFA